MRILSIQYLRGVAALLVVVAHAMLHPIDYVDVTYRRLGSFGVLLFFVISGFIMVYATGPGPFRRFDFLRRRLERVVPLYWMVTIGVAALAIVVPSFLKNTTFSWGQLAMSLLFIPYARGNGEIVPLMKLGWTLNYELFFYVVFALAGTLTAGRRVLVISVLFAVLAAIGEAVAFQSAIPKFYTEELLLTFCIGMGIGLLHLRGSALLSSLRFAPVWILLAVLFIALGFALPPDPPLGPRTDTCFTLASASLVMLGLCVERNMPVSRTWLTLGDASYAMYLTHMYFVAASIMIVRKLTGTPLPWLDVASAIVLSVAISIPVHRYLEAPIGRWLRRLDSRAQRRPGAIPSSA
jgi:exopolysaccharide production protein ExoZ